MGRRSQLLALLEEELQQINQSGDPSLALGPGIRALAADLAASLDEAESWDLPARLMLGWLKWYQFQALPEGPNQAAADEALEMLTPAAITIGMWELPEPLLPALADRAAPRSAAMLEHAIASSDVGLLSDLVDHWIHLVNVTPEGHPDRAQRLSILGAGLQSRFARAGNMRDLNDALAVGRMAVELASGDRAAGMYLSNLGAALRTNYEHTHAIADLDEAISVGRRAAATTRRHPGHAVALTNLSAVLQIRFDLTGGWEDLVEGIDVARQALDATPTADPNRAAILNNLSSALHNRFKRTGAAADLDEAVAFGRRATEASAGHPDEGKYLSNLGGALENRFEKTGLRADLDEAVSVLRRAAAATPAKHRARASRLVQLSTALRTSFERTGAAAQGDEAVATARQAVDSAASDDHSGRAAMLTNLGYTLLTRYGYSGVRADLDDAITANRQAVDEVAADDPQRGLYQSSLDFVLWERLRLSQSPDDLDEAISVRRLVLEAASTDLPDRTGHKMSFARALLTRYEQHGAIADLDETVAVSRTVIGATAVDHPERCDRLSMLGGALLFRFLHRESLGDLDEALTVMREAREAAGDGPEQANCLSNLAVALKARFDRLNSARDLDEAVAVGRLAVDTKRAGDRDRASVLSNLSLALRSRATLVGSPQDLDEAITLARGAVDITALGDPEQATYLANLGLALQTRFGRSGMLADVDEAVVLGRHAVEAAAGARLQQAEFLGLLGDSLTCRFDWTGARTDIDEAIEMRRLAVEATDVDHVERLRRIATLGSALRSRSALTGEVADVDEAVELSRQIIESASFDDHDLSPHLAFLSNALHHRFELTRDPSNLDEAVALGRRVVELKPVDNADWVGALANLSGLLRNRFAFGGNPIDINDAIDIGREAVAAFGDDHPNRSKALLVLADALRTRSKRDRASADREEALELLAKSAGIDTAPPWQRIYGARTGARLAVSSDPALAAELLEAAVLLLPQLAPRRMRRKDQEHAIGSVANIADDAAALALADPTYPTPLRGQRALSLLEAGRAVLLSQVLDARSDLSELGRQYPEIAARFAALRESLDRDLGPAPEADGSANGRPNTLDERITAATELAATLAAIRALDGFANFAMPPTLEEMLAETDQGPIVTFNVSAYRSDALLLTLNGVMVLPLPALTPQAVTDQVNAFHQALHNASDPAADRVAAQATLSAVLEWLWDNAAGPVLSALGYHSTPPPQQSEWPRVWWAPGGHLSLLPLHAAGHHSGASSADRQTVMDRVVPSQTPSIRALRHARRRQAAAVPASDAATSRSLIIGMPTTPGPPSYGRLQNVQAEVEMLSDLLPNPLILIEPDSDLDSAPNSHTESAISVDASYPYPTRDRVLAELPGRPIVHFACHGDYDPEDPSGSRILLHDHERNPFTVASLGAVNLEGAQLAYLSACHTAMNAADHLLDEAMHLAGAFQVAGFPQVIGTLWTLDDEIAVEIAEDFYSLLHDQRTGALDLKRAAYALHHATRVQRDKYPETPSLWASHLHTGA